MIGKGAKGVNIENIVYLIIGASLLAGFAPTLLTQLVTLVDVFLNATGLSAIDSGLVVGGLMLAAAIAFVRKGASAIGK